MDVQVSDGWGMLLKYVTSYVTKMHDNDILNGNFYLTVYCRNSKTL